MENPFTKIVTRLAAMLACAAVLAPASVQAKPPSIDKVLNYAILHVPPSWLLGGLLGFATLGFILRYRDARPAFVWGAMLVATLSAMALLLLLLVGGFSLLRNKEIRDRSAPAASSPAKGRTCRTAGECMTNELCTTIGQQRLCRLPCDPKGGCPAGHTCVTPKVGARVCVATGG